MGNVMRFPSSPRVALFLAEEQTKSDARQEFGAAVGLLHGNPTTSDLFEVLARAREAARMVENIIAMREAHS